MRLTGLSIHVVMILLMAASSFGADRPIKPEDRAHWAFVRPRKAEIPAVKETGWTRNVVDAFVLAKLESEGLAHAPEADRPTLLRRLSFDLIGLPPTPEELHAFEADRSPDAYEWQVDRLLSSPRFGERQAQHWLDLARYADTDGFEFDEARPDAWRYRDWVVRAFNADMPYDRFVALQLAGDEREPDDPEAVIATGFNRCYPDMVDLNDQGLRRQNALDDITETVGLAFMGLTIGCARCHDHKFDPVSQVDFYSLQAFFTPARFRDDYPIVGPAIREEYEARLADWKKRLSAAQARVLRIEAPARARLAPLPQTGLDDRVIAALAKGEDDRTPEEVGLVFETLSKDKRVNAKDIVQALDPESRGDRSEALSALGRINAEKPASPPKARVIDEPGPEPPPTFLRRRGTSTPRGPRSGPRSWPSSPNRSRASSRRRGPRADDRAWPPGSPRPTTH